MTRLTIAIPNFNGGEKLKKAITSCKLIKIPQNEFDILVVDKIAEIFILGCTVDYVREFGGSYLKVVNPNATAQCGCGESFAV